MTVSGGGGDCGGIHGRERGKRREAVRVCVGKRKKGGRGDEDRKREQKEREDEQR